MWQSVRWLRRKCRQLLGVQRARPQGACATGSCAQLDYRLPPSRLMQGNWLLLAPLPQTGGELGRAAVHLPGMGPSQFRCAGRRHVLDIGAGYFVTAHGQPCRTRTRGGCQGRNCPQLTEQQASQPCGCGAAAGLSCMRRRAYWHASCMSEKGGFAAVPPANCNNHGPCIVQDAAAGVLQRVDELTLDSSGRFVQAATGEVLPW